MATPVKNEIRASITSHPKTEKFKMLSVANIIIFSTLFGVVLTKEIKGLRENEILKESSRWEASETKNKNEINERTIDCLDSSSPSTRISLNPPKQCDIEDGSAYEKPARRRAQVLEHVRLVSV